MIQAMCQAVIAAPVVLLIQLRNIKRGFVEMTLISFEINKVYNTITEQIKVHKTYGKIGITPLESW